MRAQVEGETKVSKLPKLDATLGSETPGQTKELEQLENLRQMFVAMTDDYRIILCGNQTSGAPRVPVSASARWRRGSTPSTQHCNSRRGSRRVLATILR